MDYQLIAAIIFILFLIIFLYVKRKQIQIEKILFPFLYMILYRTKLGLKHMESLAKKYPKILKAAAIAGIFVGFAGMAFIACLIVDNIIKMFLVPGTTAGVMLVLPFKLKGVFYVPFFYWIITIFIIAGIHEFSHGVIARAYGIKIKSSGFAFLSILAPIIPAAFVEPEDSSDEEIANYYARKLKRNKKLANDKNLNIKIKEAISAAIKNLKTEKTIKIKAELPNKKTEEIIFTIRAGEVKKIKKQLEKKGQKALNDAPKKEQMGVFAAGPFSNVILAVLVLLLLKFAFYPIVMSMNEPNGMLITELQQNGTIHQTNLEAGDIITGINNASTLNYANFTAQLLSHKPGETVTLNTNKGDFDVKLETSPVNSSVPYLGIVPDQNTEIKEQYKNSSWLNEGLLWFAGNPYKLSIWTSFGLLGWIYLLSLGIGLFNLLPLGPVDGGRMLLALLEKYTKSERAHKIWKWISIAFLLIVLVLLIATIYLAVR